MKFKGLEFTGIEQMINPEKDERLESAWENSLACQVYPEPLLPYSKVRDELFELFTTIFK